MLVLEGLSAVQSTIKGEDPIKKEVESDMFVNVTEIEKWRERLHLNPLTFILNN